MAGDIGRVLLAILLNLPANKFRSKQRQHRRFSMITCAVFDYVYRSEFPPVSIFDRFPLRQAAFFCQSCANINPCTDYPFRNRYGGQPPFINVFRMVRETGVDGAMVGRAALGDPWWFRDLRDLAAGRAPRRPTVDEVRATIREHLRREIDLMARRRDKELKLGAELTACLVMRPHLVRYLRGFRGFGALARTLEERVDAATLLGRVDEVLASGRKCERSGEPETEAAE